MLTRGQISRMPTKVKRNYDCIGREGLFLQPCSWRPKRRFCHAARLPAHLASQPWENSKDAKPCRQKVVKGCRSSPTYRRLNTSRVFTNFVLNLRGPSNMERTLWVLLVTAGLKQQYLLNHFNLMAGTSGSSMAAWTFWLVSRRRQWPHYNATMPEM